MYIRVIRVRLRPGKVDEMLGRWRTEFAPALARVGGFSRAWFAGNHELNTVAVVTLWAELPRATVLGPLIDGFEQQWADLYAAPTVIEEFEVLAEVEPGP